MYKKIILLLLALIIILPEMLSAYETDETIFIKGLNYYIKREFKTAAEEWKKVLDRNPAHTRAKLYMEKAYQKYNDMEINFYTGLGLFLKEKYCECIPYLKKTLMINPRHQKAIYYAKLAYNLCNEIANKKEASKKLVDEAQKFIAEDEYAKAIGIYKMALLLDPDNEYAKAKIIEAQKAEMEYNKNLELMMHLQAAREYHNKKEYMEAIQEWSKALMIAPDNIEAQEGLKRDKELLRLQQLQEKINALISKGIDYFVNRKYYDSRDTFLEVLKLDKDNKTAKEYLKKIDYILKALAKQKSLEDEAEKHFILGLNHFNKEEWESALDEFNITLDIKPDHQKAIEYRNKVLAILKRLKEQQEKDKYELIQKLLSEGIKYYQVGEYELAIERFKAVLNLDPENEYAKEYLRLALQALQLEKDSQINEDSPYYVIVKNLEREGLKYLNLKEYQNSIRFFKEIKELFPLNKMANKYILKIMYITDPDKAKDILDAHFNKGKESYNNKNFIRALYEFELIKEIDPKYPEIDKYLNLAKHPPSLYAKEIKKYYNLGLLYYSQKKYEDAIAEWKKSIELDKSPLSNKYLKDALSNIAKAEYRIKASKGTLVSEKQISKQVTKKQRMIKKHFYMGVAHYTSGEYEEALKEWQEVLKLDPYNPKALKNIEKCKKKIKAQK